MPLALPKNNKILELTEVQISKFDNNSNSNDEFKRKIQRCRKNNKNYCAIEKSGVFINVCIWFYALKHKSKKIKQETKN